MDINDETIKSMKELFSAMDNDDLLRATRDFFEAKGLCYNAGLSEISNGDIYADWDEDKQIETVASFNYDCETGFFESVLLSFYGAEQELLTETVISISSLESLTALEVKMG